MQSILSEKRLTSSFSMSEYIFIEQGILFDKINPFPISLSIDALVVPVASIKDDSSTESFFNRYMRAFLCFEALERIFESMSSTLEIDPGNLRIILKAGFEPRMKSWGKMVFIACAYVHTYLFLIQLHKSICFSFKE